MLIENLTKKEFRNDDRDRLKKNMSLVRLKVDLKNGQNHTFRVLVFASSASGPGLVPVAFQL